MPALKDPRDLQELRAANARFNEVWKQRGGRLTSYKCPDCGKRIQVRRPRKSDCSGDCWSSLTTCIECGQIHMLLTYPSGRTVVGN